MIDRIISGGQTGADQAGLHAAKYLGIQTGGYAPKGWKTENGSDPSLAEFGLVEHSSTNYKDRTIANAQSADGTAWFGLTDSPGAKVTLNAAKNKGLPICVNPRSHDEFRSWIRENNIKVLNVAGNRESKRPGIFQRVYDFLVVALKEENQ